MPILNFPFTYTITAVPKGKRKEREQLVLGTVPVDIPEVEFLDLLLVLRVTLKKNPEPFRLHGGLLDETADYRRYGDGLISDVNHMAIPSDQWERFCSMTSGVKSLDYSPMPMWTFSVRAKDMIPSDEVDVRYGDIRASDEEEARNRVIEEAPRKLAVIDGKVFATTEYVWPTQDYGGSYRMVNLPMPLDMLPSREMVFRIDRHDEAIRFVSCLAARHKIEFPDIETGDAPAPGFDEGARLVGAMRAVIEDLQKVSPYARAVLRQDAAFFAEFALLRDAANGPDAGIRPAMERFLGVVSALPMDTVLWKEVQPWIRALLTIDPVNGDEPDPAIAPAP